MNRKQGILVAAAVAVILSGTAVYATEPANGEQNDAAAITQAKIGLGQAIANAERHVHGKATRAELENENGRLVYGVEVVSGGKVTDVKVDIRNGNILSAQADHADHEGQESGREGGRGDD